MDWQQAISLTLVAGAATALLWGRFRRRTLRLGRDTHCVCAGRPGSASPNSIIFHARKGERPLVLVKMK